MRLRETETLSPEIERELDALDAALAGHAVDPELIGVAELARELRAQRPVPRPEFAAGLDARATEGFPRADSTGPVAWARGWIVARPPHRILAPALGAATLAVVVAVAISQGGGSGGGELTTATQPSGAAESLQGPAKPAPAGEAAPAQPAPSDIGVQTDRQGLVPGQQNRKVEQAAQLSLSTEPDDVTDVADDVIAVTDRYRGIVVSSQVSGGDGESSVARFDLAIPATRLQDALADISALADVSARSESMLDITQPFVSARQRLADARAELESLLEQLAAADSPGETASIRERIDAVRGEIAQARSQVEDLARRARFARVSVTVEGDGGDGGDGWSLGDAADDSVAVLRTIAGVALVSLAILVPVGVVAAIGWLIARGTARRRRERALD